MKVLPILLASLILACFACGKHKLNVRTAKNCPLIAEAEILSENNLPCNYNEVYSFEGKIYTRCVCCLCNKVSIPVDCDGQGLCEFFNNDCLVEFTEQAIYLFSIEEL